MFLKRCLYIAPFSFSFFFVAVMLFISAGSFGYQHKDGALAVISVPQHEYIVDLSIVQIASRLPCIVSGVDEV